LFDHWHSQANGEEDTWAQLYYCLRVRDFPSARSVAAQLKKDRKVRGRKKE
jgi:hypothetical protein